MRALQELLRHKVKVWQAGGGTEPMAVDPAWGEGSFLCEEQREVDELGLMLNENPVPFISMPVPLSWAPSASMAIIITKKKFHALCYVALTDRLQ